MVALARTGFPDRADPAAHDYGGPSQLCVRARYSRQQVHRRGPGGTVPAWVRGNVQYQYQREQTRVQRRKSDGMPGLGLGPSQRARWARWGRQMREIRGTGLWLSLRLACRLVSLAGWPGPRYNVGERRWWRCARVIPSLDPGGEGRALCTLSGSRETAIWRVASQGRPGVLNNTEFAALANSVMTGSTQRGLKSGLAHFRCLLHESICRLAGAASPVPTLSDTFLSVQSDTPTPKRLE